MDAVPDATPDVLKAAAILALDPTAIGGVALRAGPGPARDQWLAFLAALAGGPVRKLPLGISDDRLLGGLDLPATLAAGSPRHRRGLLAEAEGGILLVAMAERVRPGTAARIAQALDGVPLDGVPLDGVPLVGAPLDGLPLDIPSAGPAGPARFGLVLLDEGIDDETPAACLRERVGIHLTLAPTPLPSPAPPSPEHLEAARARLPHIRTEDAALEALCTAAAALGIDSARPPLLALRVARAAAALDGREDVGPGDVALAARLVLGPRATTLPADAPPEPEPDAEPDPPPEGDDDPAPQNGETLADQVLEAARAAIPPGLLALLQSGAPPRARTPGRAGALVRGARGRPVGARPGLPRDGARLDLMATLRAAAPWQRLRGGGPPIRLRRDDLRIARREQRAETVTIFLVDASGSSALNRLAEAKGAVELLLADCYVRRDQVAVIAFRGKAATLLLPPTRSLVRAKRGLAGLPGGGGTPLAAGIEAGALMADGVRRRGATPTLVLLTDGQANVGRDGRGGRAQAQLDATAAARAVRAAGHATLFIDTSPRANPVSRDLAAAMGGRYLALPYADAASLSRSVRGLA